MTKLNQILTWTFCILSIVFFTSFAIAAVYNVPIDSFIGESVKMMFVLWVFIGLLWSGTVIYLVTRD
jgi:hypothetical protein